MVATVTKSNQNEVNLLRMSVFAGEFFYGTRTSSKHSHKDLQQNTVIIPSTTKNTNTTVCFDPTIPPFNPSTIISFSFLPRNPGAKTIVP
jgi:hypothetical protein